MKACGGNNLILWLNDHHELLAYVTGPVGYEVLPRYHVITACTSDDRIIEITAN